MATHESKHGGPRLPHERGTLVLAALGNDEGDPRGAAMVVTVQRES